MGYSCRVACELKSSTAYRKSGPLLLVLVLVETLKRQ
jgi:hypothetical protein